jgi:hypothetical protein
MKFIINGKRFSIKNINPQIDELFLKLHYAFIGDGVLNWDEFIEKSKEFFTEVPDTGIQDTYFSNFTILWRNLLNSGNYDKAEEIWEMALEAALAWENENNGKRIHKGTPYYFWATTALIRGDIDKGYSLMHHALQEDIQTSGTRYPPTPTFAFVTADFTKVEQFFRQWPLEQAQYIENRLQLYRKTTGKILTLDQFREKFLCSKVNTSIIYLLAYTISRLKKFEELPKYVFLNQFASQLQLNILFDLALIVDEAIFETNPSSWKFIDQASYVSRKCKLLLSKSKLKEINKSYNTDFEKTITSLINGVYQFKDGSIPSGLSNDLAITYGIRNRGAHKTSSVMAICGYFQVIEKMIFNILFLIVEELY